MLRNKVTDSFLILFFSSFILIILFKNLRFLQINSNDCATIQTAYQFKDVFYDEQTNRCSMDVTLERYYAKVYHFTKKEFR